jgi:hypothetical protein
MLILQGTADPIVNLTVTTATVENTCALFPTSPIEYMIIEGSSHVPTLYATQQVWLEWIADRFTGVHVDNRCSTKNHASLRRLETYQGELAYYLQIALESYEVA